MDVLWTFVQAFAAVWGVACGLVSVALVIGVLDRWLS